MMTILSIAYPFARVAPETSGGAEQVLLTLDRALGQAGHRSLVIAAEGSQICGELIAAPAIPNDLDAAAQRRGHAAYRAVIATVLARHAVDLVHMHGVDFQAYLPPPGPPVLVTLHLPLSWYSPDSLRPRRPQTFLNCVSASQAAGTGLPAIENGIDLDAFCPQRKDDFALFLGRICPEKGVHLAVEAAKRADMPLLIAGDIFPYPAHRAYFAREVAPRLDDKRRYIGPVGQKKRDLLAQARCVLIPSLAEETSSLVAREAAASGAPVIAFDRGALGSAVIDGRTGFLVTNAAEMALAMARLDRIAPAACRAHAEQAFSAQVMAARYFDLYAQLARRAA